jgi:hypothetical protein
MAAEIRSMDQVEKYTARELYLRGEIPAYDERVTVQDVRELAERTADITLRLVGVEARGPLSTYG